MLPVSSITKATSMQPHPASDRAAPNVSVIRATAHTPKLLIANDRFILLDSFIIPNPPSGPKVLENQLSIVTVIPQTINSGITVHANVGDIIPVIHTKGNSIGVVTVQVTDPTAITGHDYQITFDANGDGLWKLTDVTINKVKISNQSQNQGDTSPVIDGLKVYVSNPTIIKSCTFTPTTFTWLQGINWGGSFLEGGLDIGTKFQGSNITSDQYKTIEIRFLSTATGQNAYRYLRGGTVNYGYQDYKPQYFTVWDVTSTPNVQLSAGYVNQKGSSVEGLPWQPTDDSGTGGADRQYLFIFDTPYSATPDPLYSDSSTSFSTLEPSRPIMYAMWPCLPAGGTFSPQNGQIMTITPNLINTSSDVFSFSTSGFKADTTLTKVLSNSTKISYGLSQNFPNPFNPTTVINYSIEKSGFVSIKVYNVLGQEVATLVNGKKSVGNYQINFDTAKYGLSSGIYLYTIRVNEYNVAKKMILLK